MAKKTLLIGRVMFYLFALIYVASTFYWLPNLNISIWLSLGIILIGTIIIALMGAIIGILIERHLSPSNEGSDN